MTRQSPLVRRTLAGIHRVHGNPVHRKQPLTPNDLLQVAHCFPDPIDYDDLLFKTLLFVGFDQLLHLGKLCPPYDPRLYNVHHSLKCYEVCLSPSVVRLLLLGHKGNKFFEGSTLQFSCSTDPISPFCPFHQYLSLRDQCFRWLPKLWLLSTGVPPTHSWFLSRFRRHFPTSILGHSMRTGGATVLALAGVPDERI